MLNAVELIGHLGADPEVRTTAAGDTVATLNLATSEKWKDRSTGEPRERTEWHRVVLWAGLADVAQRYLRKGGRCYVRGQLRTRKWQDQSGNDRWTTEVTVSGFAGQLILLGDARGSQDGGNAPPAPPPADLADDIPF